MLCQSAPDLSCDSASVSVDSASVSVTMPSCLSPHSPWGYDLVGLRHFAERSLTGIKPGGEEV